MKIEQSEHYTGDDWWSWSVWLEGTDAELDAVDYVEWRLHPTFPEPVRIVRDRATNFRLDTGGWGTFRVQAAVHLKSKESVRLRHELALHYPDGRQSPA